MAYGRQSIAALVSVASTPHSAVSAAMVALLVIDQADASIRAVSVPQRRLPAGIRHTHVFDEPEQLLTGPRHPLANEKQVTPAQLRGHRIWMPILPAGSEWADYFDAVAAEFGLRIEQAHPDFGTEPLHDVIADSADIVTFVPELMQILWPDGHDLRRILIRDPALLYPNSLIWRKDNPHPTLAALRRHVTVIRPVLPNGPPWLPSWSAVRRVNASRSSTAAGH